MQKIRYNFRNNDSILELNEHFLGIAVPGVKSGLTIELNGTQITINPGHLMTRRGVLITETDSFQGPSLDPMTNNQGSRVDVLVADYTYEEKLNPNTCTYKLIKGTEVISGYPAIPPLEHEDQTALAHIYMSKGVNTDTAYTFRYPQGFTRYDVGRNRYMTGEYHSEGFNVTRGSGTAVIVDGLYAIIDGLSIVPTSNAIINVPFHNLTIDYTANSGLFEANADDTPHDRYMLYVKPTDPTFDWSTVTEFKLNVYHNEDGYNAGLAMEYTVTSFDNVVNQDTKEIWIAIPDIYAIKSLSMSCATDANFTFRAINIKPVFIVSNGIPYEGPLNVLIPERIDTDNKKAIICNNLFVDIRNCLLVGYIIGTETDFSIVNVRPSSNKYIFSNVPMSYGIQKLYHFLCRTDFTMHSVDIENTAFTSNEEVTDTTGTRTIHKDELGIRVFRTGGGDQTKKSDYIIYL